MLKSTKAVGAVSILPTFSFAGTNLIPDKIKVVLIGTGSRGSSCWGKDLVGPYRDYVEMVGLCDINQKRVEVAKSMIGIDAKTYHSSKFDQMISEQKPDVVIVTTTDCYHVDYILRALELGCDVISEKPIPGDIDLDNDVDLNDLVQFAQWWLTGM